MDISYTTGNDRDNDNNSDNDNDKESLTEWDLWEIKPYEDYTDEEQDILKIIENMEKKDMTEKQQYDLFCHMRDEYYTEQIDKNNTISNKQ